MAAVTVSAIASIGVVSSALAGGGPRTDSVLAVANLVHVPGDKTRTCEGTDGTYSEGHETAIGTQTSADPRLTGKAVFELDVLVNDNTHEGTFEATTKLLDPATGQVKSRGKVYGVVEGVTIKGSTIQRLADGGRLMAIASGIYEPKAEPPHSVVLEFGVRLASPSTWHRSR